MEKNGLKVSRAKTDHNRGDRSGWNEELHGDRNGQLANSPVLQISWINDRQERRSQQRHGEQSGKGMVEIERTEWRDLRQESPNEIEDPDIYQTVIRPTLLYGCETWPMSVKDERRMATTEMRMVRWAMGVSRLEHRRNDEILEEAKVE